MRHFLGGDLVLNRGRNSILPSNFGEGLRSVFSVKGSHKYFNSASSFYIDVSVKSRVSVLDSPSFARSIISASTISRGRPYFKRESSLMAAASSLLPDLGG